MATGIPDLWPESLDVDVLSPVVILRRQADALEQRTKGILTGQVESVSGEDKTQLTFDIVARAIGDFTYRLLTVTHGKGMVYPAVVEATFYCLKDRMSKTQNCANDKELMSALALVFSASETSSVLASVIARSNEVAKSE